MSTHTNEHRLIRGKVTFLAVDQSNAYALVHATKLLSGYDIPFEVCIRTQDQIKDMGAEKFMELIHGSKITILCLTDKQNLPNLKNILPLLGALKIPVILIPHSADAPSFRISSLQPQAHSLITQYITYGGVENFKNLLLFLANCLYNTNFKVSPPENPILEGIWHPLLGFFADRDEYLRKYGYTKDKPTIGVMFHQNSWWIRDTSFVEALVTELERNGAQVIPIFFSNTDNSNLSAKKLELIIERYFMMDGKPLVDAVISTMPFSLVPSAHPNEVSGILRKLRAVFVKAILTCNTPEEWLNSPQGLNEIEISSNVTMPEFDGLLITIPVAALYSSEIDQLTGVKLLRFTPILDRVSKVVKLTLNWAHLRRIPKCEKKIAIILNNYPPRNDTVGEAFGLDVPKSLLNLLRELRNAGYTLDYMPKNEQEVINDIINGLTNDHRWLSIEDMAQRAVARVSRDQYINWFNELPQAVKRKMLNDWGEPPGKLFNYKGDLLIAGISNGNIFIGIQPPRGFTENLEAVYHKPDLSMSHYYYAYYKWIKEIFKADLVIHFGTHGSLEWLPGKSVGLSAFCFPDIAIADLPNIYPYIINNPAEGAQAKRRSYCCIIDHLIPPMQESGVYNEISCLEKLIEEYHQAKLSNRERMSEIQNKIWAEVCKIKLNCDLQVNMNNVFSSFDSFIEKLHSYINEIALRQIRDGLHVLGEPPENEKLDEFLFSLTKLSNGNVPSLIESIAEIKRYNFNDLISSKGKFISSLGKTNGEIIRDISTSALELLRNFRKENFNKEKMDLITLSTIGGVNSNIKQTLAYISEFLAPALQSTTQELTNTILACNGEYILPGPSGSPTRGKADILPTGRNFYFLDIHAIPSPFAWQIGTSLAEEMIKRHLTEDGKYPESIGFYLRATDTIKTNGENIAIILHLIGVKPVWDETSWRVKGVEAVPLENLGRPRIDVTIRITGLFRDMFPNLIYMLDDAIKVVVSLNEPEDKNYILKHSKAIVKEKAGADFNGCNVSDEIYYRIFGEPPGAYGCGVSYAIDSKNWKEQKDLSHIYLNWGCHVYSRKKFGCPSPNLFKSCLSNIDIAAINIYTHEYDILDSDDWYEAQGGMILARKVLTGKTPKAYCCDTVDPKRAKVKTTVEEIRQIFRSRILNPKWIESMKKHGYHGAGSISQMFSHILGWSATADFIENWMYEGLAQKYILDTKTQKWFKEVNPYALHNIVEGLLEAIQRGLWHADEHTAKKLRSLYLEIEGVIEYLNGETNKVEKKKN